MSFEAVRPRAGIEGFAETEQGLGITWLRKLRWGAVFGQVLAVTVAWAGLGLELPYPLLLGFVVFTALGNLALGFVPVHADRGFWLPAVLFADVLVLTAFLAYSGGAANPFTVFFLVHVALSSVLLDARLTWALVLLTVLGFGSLFLMPGEPAMMMHHHQHEEQPWSAHLVGMWVAYALAASFVAYFVGKVSRAIRDRDQKLAAIAKLAMQNQRLAALSSFSASAAHELGSPLATIGLAAKELRLGLDADKSRVELTADAELVCYEVARCRQILAGLSSRAGETVGEMPAPTTASALVSELEQLLPARSAERVSFEFSDEASSRAPIVAPLHTLTQLLHNLVKNALEAQEETGNPERVEVRISVAERLKIHVLDRGRGVPDELRDRLGEPFVTSKSERGGLGLGVYLVSCYAERTRGSLSFRKRSGGGSEVELDLPPNALSEAVA